MSEFGPRPGPSSAQDDAYDVAGSGSRRDRQRHADHRIRIDSASKLAIPPPLPSYHQRGSRPSEFIDLSQRCSICGSSATPHASTLTGCWDFWGKATVDRRSRTCPRPQLTWPKTVCDSIGAARFQLVTWTL